jgi:hypothetical protein
MVNRILLKIVEFAAVQIALLLLQQRLKKKLILKRDPATGSFKFVFNGKQFLDMLIFIFIFKCSFLGATAAVCGAGKRNPAHRLVNKRTCAHLHRLNSGG